MKDTLTGNEYLNKNGISKAKADSDGITEQRNLFSELSECLKQKHTSEKRIKWCVAAGLVLAVVAAGAMFARCKMGITLFVSAMAIILGLLAIVVTVGVLSFNKYSKSKIEIEQKEKRIIELG